MPDFIASTAVVLAVANLLVGLVGSVLWWRVTPDPRWWPALRVTQAASVAFAVAAGIAAATGDRPQDGLFWLYALMPAAVSSVAEQLRAISAETVLQARDLEDAQAVGRLPEAEQRSVVLAILRRELGVMTASCFVVAFLLLRAAGTA